MLVCPECGLTLTEGTTCPHDGSSLRPRAEDGLLGQQLGSFRVARLLGQGGMGRVYLGVHPGIGSRVAIKVLSRDCADRRELVERFFAEARTVNVIRHESIVNVIDLATLEDGRPYIVMEYLEGAPLATVMHDTGPMPLGTLGRLALEVLGALGAAHQAGVVHRDLKPDNVFVTPGGHVKVLDFGIAKLRADASGRSAPTQTGSVLGTPQYMAPEQALGRPVDARADLYALGVILYEGATGRHPIQGESLYELLRAQVEQVPVPPQTFRPDLPAAYAQVIDRALAKDRDARFGSVAEFRHALDAALHDLPPDAWRPIRGPNSVGAYTGVDHTPLERRGPSEMRSTAPEVLSQRAAAAGSPSGAPPRGAPGTLGASTGPSEHKPAEHRMSRATVVLSVAAAAAMMVAVVTVGAWAFWGRSDPSSALAASTVTTSETPQDPAAATRTTPVARVEAGETKAVSDVGEPVQAEGTPRAEEPADGGAEVKPTADADVVDAEDDEDDEAEPAAAVRPSVGTRPTDASVAAPEEGSDEPSEDTPPDDAPSDAKAPAVARRPQFSAFDVTGFIPRALEMAREIYDDAVLVRIDADGVRPDGRADLTLSDDFSVLYRFNSPSRSARPADLPIGVDHKPNCKIYVNVTAEGISTYPLNGWKCDEPLIGAPDCSAKGVWSKGISRGAPSTNAVGSLGYWAGPGDVGRWHMSVGDRFSEWITDKC